MTVVYIDHGDYISSQELPTSNIKFTSGLRFQLDNLGMSIFGNFYQNNLLGFEPITVNQRTESYFDQNFGSLGIELVYHFQKN